MMENLKIQRDDTIRSQIKATFHIPKVGPKRSVNLGFGLLPNRLPTLQESSDYEKIYVSHTGESRKLLFPLYDGRVKEIICQRIIGRKIESDDSSRPMTFWYKKPECISSKSFEHCYYDSVISPIMGSIEIVTETISPCPIMER